MEWAVQQVNAKVDYGVSVITMSQYKFIDDNRCFSGWKEGSVLIIGDALLVYGQGVHGKIFLPSS